MQVSAPAPELKIDEHGYWVEPFVYIMKNPIPLTEEQFNKFANILLRHRKLGDAVKENHLFLNSNEESKAINAMYINYAELSEETDLTKRAQLLNTIFMKTLATNIESTLSPEAQMRSRGSSLRGALKSAKATDLLDISLYNNWLQSYYLGCCTKTTSEAHAALHQGCSDEEIESLTEKRGQASFLWYSPYQKGLVSKSDVNDLLIALKIAYNSPCIKKAIEAYQNLETAFGPEKKDVYWEAIFAALETFISKAH